MLENYSVLMPLWYLEKTEYLKQSLESMQRQTIPPAEIVMIADHELPTEMLDLIERVGGQCPRIPIRIIRNDDLFGKGLGAVLAYGVMQCRCDLIARMDTDDISMQERCEKELEILGGNPQIAVVGGGLIKFSSSPDRAEGYRIPPEQGVKLYRYSKFRSPFNHPTVMFRKQMILQVGNYSELRECEDYELWYRVLKAGYQGYNLQFPVLYYRSGSDMIKRRKTRRFYEQTLQLVKEMKRSGYINAMEAAMAAAMQMIRFHLPFVLNRFIYRYVKR